MRRRRLVVMAVVADPGGQMEKVENAYGREK